MSEPTITPRDRTPESELAFLHSVRDAVHFEAQKVLVGQAETIDAILVASFAEGHVLLEGVPGTAKTLAVRTVAGTLGLSFGRIQFTPDLMPGDILGTHVFDFRTGEFRLTRGPIFTELLLADEINRAPAKTQSALLEAMQERQCSIDGERHPLGDYFTVLATQNPVEQEGTYPLPEAQLDRFLLKVTVRYPTEDEEDRILERATQGVGSVDPASAGVRPVITRDALHRARQAGEFVRVDENVRRYVRMLVRATRASPDILVGAGPRAGVHLLVAARWAAALDGRLFVTPDDVMQMAKLVLAHRLVVSAEVELDGASANDVLDRVAASVEVPR